MDNKLLDVFSNFNYGAIKKHQVTRYYVDKYANLFGINYHDLKFRYNTFDFFILRMDDELYLFDYDEEFIGSGNNAYCKKVEIERLRLGQTISDRFFYLNFMNYGKGFRTNFYVILDTKYNKLVSINGVIDSNFEKCWVGNDKNFMLNGLGTLNSGYGFPGDKYDYEGKYKYYLCFHNDDLYLCENDKLDPYASSSNMFEPNCTYVPEKAVLLDERFDFRDFKLITRHITKIIKY